MNSCTLAQAKEGSDLQDIGLPAVQAAFGAAVLQAAAGARARVCVRACLCLSLFHPARVALQASR